MIGFHHGISRKSMILVLIFISLYFLHRVGKQGKLLFGNHRTIFCVISFFL